jgi:hypothetical protein
VTRAIVIALLLASARPASARPLATFVDVTRADELDDLAESGAITDDERDELDELLARGVDLERADRDELYALPNLTYAEVDAIVAYRAAHGAIGDPAALVAAGAISRAELAAIAAFVIVRGAGPRAHGILILQTRWSQADRGAPPVMARGRVIADRVEAGVGARLDRLRLGDVAWDPARRALVVDPAGASIGVPKLYVRWRDPTLDAIAGSYRAGFGQRLTFDDSYDVTPDGLYADDQLVRAGRLTRGGRAALVYESPDYGARDGLFGAALGVRAGAVRAHAWASYHRRSIYQYELYDAARCDDPRSAEAACLAPAVIDRASGARLAYATVPDVFREALAGAHVSASRDARTRIGATAYAARTIGLIAGADLGYQEWANRPGASGDGFGALGIDAAYGQRWLDLGAEVTRTFGPVRPGTGAIATATASLPRDVIEASLRWYGVDFVNPYAKPIDERDVFEGQRARDEAGARVRWAARRGATQLHAQLDVWERPAERITRTDDFVRIDHAIDAPIGWGLWLSYEDRALGAAGRGACFDAVAGETCAGKRVTTTARLHLNPSDAVHVTVQATHRVLDDPRHPTGFRHDVMAWALAAWRASDRVRVHARARLLWQDVTTPAYLERSLWGYADVTMRLTDRDAVRVRADVYAWLDSRASTLARQPNPELWLWLEYVAAW